MNPAGLSRPGGGRRWARWLPGAVLAGSAGLCAAGCASPGTDDDTAPADDDSAAGLPEQLVLDGSGVALRVQTRPYAWSVQDASGQTVLSSLGAGTGDGYGAFATAEGSLTWGTVVSPGWFSFEAELGAWSDAWTVVGASSTSASMTLDLVPAGAETDAGAPHVQVLHTLLDPPGLRVEVVPQGWEPRAVGAAFHSPGDEAFLGFGERFNRTDQRGISVYNWAEEGGIGVGEGELADPTNPMPNGEAMSYYPVPFFVSTAGYGFWLDTTWRSQFDLATDRGDAFRAWHIGPELAFEVYLPWPGDDRRWPYHVLDAFTARTGRPRVPPAWAFGPRRRVGRGDTFEGVPVIQAMRDLDLALTAVDDAVHFLPKGSHVGIEEELAAWTDDAAELGLAVCGYYNAYLSDEEDSPLRPYVEEGLAEGYFLHDAQGEPSLSWLISGDLVTIYTIDFTDPAATAWYQAMFQWAVDLGYRGWMYDFGEYVAPDVLTDSGLTGEEFHNLFPVLYQQALAEAMDASPLGDDWMAFARSGYTGASQYAPLVWSGDPAASFEDSDGLPSMVRAAINMGLSGVPHWGGDITGFHCVADGAEAADGELAARWIQQGALTPVMMDQNACKGAAEGDDDKADVFDSLDARAAWATYARLHTRLFPYLYTLSLNAGETGAPLVRHLFLEHPGDATLAGVDDAYYLGPALLVAPVVERGARQRTLALPDAEYLDWRDGARRAGPGEVVLDAPLDQLPLLLRDGGVVPLLDPRIDTLLPEANPEVVGPDDVADVYDVVVFLTAGTGTASMEVWDGTALQVDWAGGLDVGELEVVDDDDELEICGGCVRVDPLLDGVTRVRLSVGPGETVSAGGLSVSSTGGRRIRWDLYLAD